MNDETPQASAVGTGLYRYRLAREFISDMPTEEHGAFALIIGGTFTREEMRRWLEISVDLAPAREASPGA